MTTLAQARQATDTSPTSAQILAGNYRKGELRLHGMRIKLENPRGSIRRSKPGATPKWERRMPHDYGYICGVEGADGDEVDVFIGPHPESELAVVVDQACADGSFDEHKVCLGFRTVAEAKAGYLANYPKGWKLGPVTVLTVEQMKTWLASGKTKRPVNGRVVVMVKAQVRNQPSSHLGRALLRLRGGRLYPMTKAGDEGKISRGGKAQLGVDKRGRKHWRTDQAQPAGDRHPAAANAGAGIEGAQKAFSRIGIEVSEETAEKSGRQYIGFAGNTYAQLAQFRAMKDQGLVWGFRKAGKFLWACKPENLQKVTEAFGGGQGSDATATTDAKPADRPTEKSTDSGSGPAEPRSDRRGDDRGGAQPERGGDGRVPEGAKAGGGGKAADDRRAAGSGDGDERDSWSVESDAADLSDKQVLDISRADEEDQADTFIVRRGVGVTDENRSGLLAEFSRWKDAIAKRKASAEREEAKTQAAEKARIAAAVAAGKTVTVSVGRRHTVINREAAAKFSGSGPMFKVTSRGQLAVQFGGKQGYGVLPEGGGAEITIDDGDAPSEDDGDATPMAKAGPFRRLRLWLGKILHGQPADEPTPMIKSNHARPVILVRVSKQREETPQ